MGTPPTSVPQQSHTSTDQWQSFEIRMRHRRAERCVLRAEAALEAGKDDEAREALTEARALNPESPDFETLKARIDERHEASAAIARRARRVKLSAAAAALFLALGTFALFGLGGAESPLARADDPPEGGAASTGSTPVATSSTQGVEESEAARVVPTEGRVISATETEAPPSTEPAPLPVVMPPMAAEAPPDPASTKPLPTSTPSSSSPPAKALSLPPVREAEPEVKVPQPTTTETLNASAARPAAVGRLPSGLPSAPVPEPVAPPPIPVEERVVRAAEPEERVVRAVDPEQSVRTVLARFEAAYSTLNAAAARAVWPSVDEPTLARAFANLQSQRVSLGACNVRITGTTAHAECTGTTSWTPRIGGGRRTEARRWSFDLQSTDGAWHIIQAMAR